MPFDALLLLAWVHLTWADFRARSTDDKLVGYDFASGAFGWTRGPL